MVRVGTKTGSSSATLIALAAGSSSSPIISPMLSLETEECLERFNEASVPSELGVVNDSI